MGFTWWQFLIIAGVVLLFFGRGKISDIMGDVAHGIKSFKKGIRDDEEEADSGEAVKSIAADEAEAEAQVETETKAKAD